MIIHKIIWLYLFQINLGKETQKSIYFKHKREIKWLRKKEKKTKANNRTDLMPLKLRLKMLEDVYKKKRKFAPRMQETHWKEGPRQHKIYLTISRFKTKTTTWMKCMMNTILIFRVIKIKIIKTWFPSHIIEVILRYKSKRVSINSSNIILTKIIKNP